MKREKTEKVMSPKVKRNKSGDICKSIDYMHWCLEDQQLLLRNGASNHFSVHCAKVCFYEIIDFLDVMVWCL